MGIVVRAVHVKRDSEDETGLGQYPLYIRLYYN